MSDPKLTPWFEGVKPLRDRVGPYERKYQNGLILKCWWNGRSFGCGSNFAEKSDDVSIDQNLPWRGLASDPSKRG